MSSNITQPNEDFKRVEKAKTRFVIECSIADFWFQPRPRPYKSLRKFLSTNEVNDLKKNASKQDGYKNHFGVLAANTLLAEAWKRGDKTISSLPNMNFQKLLVLWQNCLSGVTQTKDKIKRYQARIIIVAINEEWLRRSNLTPEDDGYFKWPTIEAPFGEGSVQTEGWLKEGMLQFLGYRVGTTAGVKIEIRRQILHQVFSGTLPPIFPPSYMNEWAKPNSASRLKKTAETIAAFVRNARRRRDGRMELAIDDWVDDLQFLYDQYYVGTFQFGWPTTKI